MDDRVRARGGSREEVKCRPKEVGSRATRRQDVLRAQIQECEEMIVKIFFFFFFDRKCLKHGNELRGAKSRVIIMEWQRIGMVATYQQEGSDVGDLV